MKTKLIPRGLSIFLPYKLLVLLSRRSPQPAIYNSFQQDRAAQVESRHGKSPDPSGRAMPLAEPGSAHTGGGRWWGSAAWGTCSLTERNEDTAPRWLHGDAKVRAALSPSPHIFLSFLLIFPWKTSSMIFSSHEAGGCLPAAPETPSQSKEGGRPGTEAGVEHTLQKVRLRVRLPHPSEEEGHGQTPWTAHGWAMAWAIASQLCKWQEGEKPFTLNTWAWLSNRRPHLWFDFMICFFIHLMFHSLIYSFIQNEYQYKQ